MKKLTSILCLLLTLIMLFGLAGCGGKDASAPTEPAAEEAAEPEAKEPAQTEAAEPAEEAEAMDGPVYGGTLRVLTDTDGAGIAGAPWKMNANGAKVLTPCIDTLVKMDTDCNILPSLAESWEVAEDKSSITFHLRDDVTFTDGTRFDAEACAWNLRKWQEGGQISMCYA